ncbi:MAG TPA: hypothetical protein PL176_10605 [Kiritimatiellia bacterium]|nr:MAG: hypothetical protein BWX70_02078 [Verrucomicrobia bacterium ADurb.Bin070]HPO38448.1 hypothetical protein [Kiritimatiellia bacterium]
MKPCCFPLSVAASAAVCLFSFGFPVPTAQQREELLRPVDSVADPFAWWMPDGSRRGTNAVLEKAFGWGEGDAVRALERLLKEELAEPEGGDPDAVARVLDAIRLSGDMSVTDTLDGLLFSDAVPFRPELFCARASFCGLETGAFALRFVGALPVKERAACYAAAIPLMGKGEGRVTRRMQQVNALLQECAAAETDAGAAMLLDRGLGKVSVWAARNIRRHTAARFAEEPGEAGDYFRALAAEIGPPLQPDRDRFWTELFEPPWDDGHPPAGYMEGVRKWRNSRFAQDYGMTESEVVRMLEQTLLDTLEAENASDKEKMFAACLLSSIHWSGDTFSTNALEKAIFADRNWNRDGALAAYFHLAKAGVLPLIRRVTGNKDKFQWFDRFLCYQHLANSSGSENASYSDQDVSTFLKEAIAHDEENLITLDRLLLKTDSGWARSGERKKLADRLASGQEGNEYVRGQFSRVQKEFGNLNATEEK